MFSGGIEVKPENVSAVVDVNVCEKMPKTNHQIALFLISIRTYIDKTIFCGFCGEGME